MSIRFLSALCLAVAMMLSLGCVGAGSRLSWHFIGPAAAQQADAVPAASPAASLVAPAPAPVAPVPAAPAPATPAPVAVSPAVDSSTAQPSTEPPTPQPPAIQSPATQPALAPDKPALTPILSLTTPTPVVLELFTAEGCTSCLPADANVGDWAGRRSVLVLSYHVDYWDYIGWRDRKADPAFGQRQQGYMTALGRNMLYTPQLIIGGSDDELGTDHDRLAMALADSRHVARMTPLQVQRDPKGNLFLDLPTALLDKPAILWLVTYRRQVQTDILAGENAGRHLTSIDVVRSVQQLGQWSGDAARLPITVNLQAGGDLQADAFAIIANEGGYGPVVAATAIAFDSLH